MSEFNIPTDLYMASLLILPSIISALLVSPKSYYELKAQFRAWAEMHDEKKMLKNELMEEENELDYLPNFERKEGKRKLKARRKKELKQLKKEYESRIQRDCSQNQKTNILLESIAFILQFLRTFILYGIICFIAICIYAGVRAIKTNFSYPIILCNIFNSYIRTNWKKSIGLPFACALFAKAIKSLTVKIVVSSLLIAITLCMALFTSFSIPKILPMESEILAELKSNPVAFDTTFTDIKGFRTRLDKGYIEHTEEKEAGLDITEPRPAELDMDINSLNLHQLLICIYYLDPQGGNVCSPYVQRAYDLCHETEQTDRFDVGEMWYYHGKYYDKSSFVKAFEEFRNVERFWNATGSLWKYFFSSNDPFTYYDYFIESSLKSIESDLADNTLSYCEDYIEKLNDNYDIDIYGEGLSRLCSAAPDNAFLNIYDMQHRIERGIIWETDKAEIDHLLSLEAFASCPKLLLLKQYYGGDELDRIYDLYLQSPDFFEVEDRINLAWFFYEKGEYQVAFSITKDQSKSGVDVNPMEVLIRAEAFLQGDLYANEEEIYREVAVASRDWNKNNRIDLIKLILENRLGLETSYSGLSSVCKSVFDSGSPRGLFIIASLENEDGLYVECTNHCVEILERITASDELYYRVLFLQADALMNMASLPAYEEIRDELYNKAEVILLEVRKAVGTTYETCLERLAELYQKTDNIEKRDEVIKILSAIRGL